MAPIKASSVCKRLYWGRVAGQWHCYGAGPCGRIRKGPLFPTRGSPPPLPFPTAMDPRRPAYTARLAHPIVTPLVPVTFGFFLVS